jgi:methyltransferase (TIGR00027 family)
MHEDRPSVTAQWVAAARALTPLLPGDARLVDDPFGERVTLAPLAAMARLARRRPRLQPLLQLAATPLLVPAAYMQVRTRLIDDEVRDFFRAGPGRQLVILGAGFDARAHRLGDVLAGAPVFEIDHPATQRLKRSRFGEGRATYVAWDFERDPPSALPARLGELGHDPARPTLTVWEGVTTYLTEPAVAASAAAIAAWSAPGSWLSFTYFDRAELRRPSLRDRLLAAVVRRAGEPFRFGWAPEALGAWWQDYGFAVVRDEEMVAAANRLLPPGWGARFGTRTRHVALVERV